MARMPKIQEKICPAVNNPNPRRQHLMPPTYYRTTHSRLDLLPEEERCEYIDEEPR